MRRRLRAGTTEYQPKCELRPMYFVYMYTHRTAYRALYSGSNGEKYNVRDEQAETARPRKRLVKRLDGSGQATLLRCLTSLLILSIFLLFALYLHHICFSEN